MTRVKGNIFTADGTVVCYHTAYRLIEQCECNLQRHSSRWDGASVLSARPPKPEKLLYSTLHLQTDSSFTGLARRKWDWVSFFSDAASALPDSVWATG